MSVINFDHLPTFKTQWTKLAGPWVEIGDRRELTPSQYDDLFQVCLGFRPWKKGPFRFFGIEIDAEWRSDLKWQRVEPVLGSLEGKTVADIGCHNGYFMFRMAAQQPKLVVGFEPYGQHHLNYQLLQRYAQIESLRFEPVGVEQLHLYPAFFDTVFCMGILYHHPDPIGILRKIQNSLVPGGELIIECQGIPGETPTALVPQKRYAGAKGIWFLPTASCLDHWITRAGFRHSQCFYQTKLTSEEQRSTKWAPISSLSDFLAPDDEDLTIEGYPAPYRFYFRAEKP